MADKVNLGMMTGLKITSSRKLNCRKLHCDNRIITLMTLLIILFFVFVAVALMVILGQRFGKPMEAEQQQKYSKILWVVVFIAIIAGIIRQMM